MSVRIYSVYFSINLINYSQCKRVAEQRVRKYLDLLFKCKYVGVSLAEIPLASSPNDIYGVAEVESQIDGVIHKTYLTGNMDIGLGIVAARSAKDLPTNKLPGHPVNAVDDISGSVYDILMNVKGSVADISLVGIRCIDETLIP